LGLLCRLTVDQARPALVRAVLQKYLSGTVSASSLRREESPVRQQPQRRLQPEQQQQQRDLRAELRPRRRGSVRSSRSQLQLRTEPEQDRHGQSGWTWNHSELSLPQKRLRAPKRQIPVVRKGSARAVRLG